METDGSGRTVNDRGLEVEEREREKRGLLLGGPPAAQPLLHAVGGRARREDRPRAEPAGEVARVRAQGAADGREHRGRRGRGPRGARLSGADRVGPVRTELIVATYENPRALGALPRLGGAAGGAPGSIAIADDGSGPETKAVVDAFAARIAGARSGHVWHEDRGFQKNAILNRAIASSEAEFLVFIDGDVLVRPDFVGHHLALARPDRWSSGSLIRLDAAATAAVTEELVASGRVFDRDWLRAHRAIDRFGTWLKTRPLPAPLLAALDVVTPVQKAWGGANSSAFRAALARGQRLRRDDEVRRRGQGARGAADQQRRARPAPALRRLGRAPRPPARLPRPRADARPTRRASARRGARAGAGRRTASSRGPRA